jgi:hypothetical protein
VITGVLLNHVADPDAAVRLAIAQALEECLCRASARALGDRRDDADVLVRTDLAAEAATLGALVAESNAARDFPAVDVLVGD